MSKDRAGKILIAIFALVASAIGLELASPGTTTNVVPKDHVFNKRIVHTEAQAYADDNGFELLGCNEAIGWCKFSGNFSLTWRTLTDDFEQEGELGIFPPTESDTRSAAIQTDVLFNDPEYSSQWNMFASGFDKVLNQDSRTCSTDVRVVVIDTGYSHNHNDLDSVSNCYHTVPNTCIDGNGHGTHVLGTGAMLVNNSLGGSGAAPGCDYKSIKALSDWGSGNFFDISLAITQAVDLFDAHVINMSIGAEGDTPRILADALDYVELAGRGGKGAVVVAAAGNMGSPICATPARYSTVLCVGAIDQNGNMPGFSNRGQHLDLVAPGVDIFSTINNNGWARWNGTSMASPHVAMAVAMFLSNDPDAANMTAAQIRDHVRNTAGEAPSCSTCANGQLDVVSMLGAAVEPTPTVTSPAPTVTPVLPTPTADPTECSSVMVSDFPGVTSNAWYAWNMVAANNLLFEHTTMSYQESLGSLSLQVTDPALCSAWTTIFETEGYTVND